MPHRHLRGSQWAGYWQTSGFDDYTPTKFTEHLGPLPEGIPMSPREKATELLKGGAESMTGTVSTVVPIVGRAVDKEFRAARPSVKAATVATAAAGLLGTATGQFSANEGMMVAAVAPSLPFARRGVEAWAAKERQPLRKTLNPVRFVQNLMTAPGDPHR